MTIAISADDMKGKLIPLADVEKALSSTEPLDSVSFNLDGTASFEFATDEALWNLDALDVASNEPVGVSVSIGGNTVPLSKDAALEATSYIGLPKAYVQRTPGGFIQGQLNYHYSKREDKTAKLLVGTDGTGLAFTKSTIVPFSNLRFLEDTVDAIRQQYGSDTEILADYKFFHDLRRTYLRLVVPERERALRDGDPWSLGVQFKNSLIGAIPTEFNAYMFRWECTNGSISTHNSSGAWSRRHGSGDEVYEWARASIEDILGGMEHEFEAIEEMTSVGIDGEINDVMADVFRRYRIPQGARDAIIHEMVETDDLTMYGLINAITQAANHDDLTPEAVERLMLVGGDLPHAAAERCAACHRLAV